MPAPLPLDSDRLERAPGLPTRSPLHRSPTGGPAWDDELSTDARAALATVLAPSERVDLVAPAVGCVVVLTRIRVAVVRDGASYRPKSGIRSFALDHDLAIRIGPQRHRVIIEAAGTTITVFLRAEQLEAASRLVAEAKRRIYQG